MFQHGERGVAEPQSANHNVQTFNMLPAGCSQCQPGKLGFRFGEQARHEEFIAEFYLVDEGSANSRFRAASQADVTERRGLIIQFFKFEGHCMGCLRGEMPAARHGLSTCGIIQLRHYDAICADAGWPVSCERKTVPAGVSACGKATITKKGQERIDECEETV